MVVTTAAATAPLLPSPRVWIRSAHAAASSAQPCLFGKSMFDALLVADGSSSSPTVEAAATSRHYDRQLVSLKEVLKKQDYHVLLEPTTTKTTSSTQALPLGRAKHYPRFGATACPAMVKGPPETPNPKKPHPQLGVVGLVLDPSGERVLLTRRPSYMRTFPGAWVLPGGGWDAGTDELLEDCLKREILEETGLKIALQEAEGEEGQSQDKKSPLPVSLWESCFPTDPCAPGPIKSHYLVVFLRTYLAQESLQLLRLQESEVESALWLSVEQFQKVLEQMKGEGTSTQSSSSSDLLTIHNADGSTHRAPLDTIVGIYPQPDKSEKFEWCGIAQGSLFALEELLLRSQRENNGQRTLAGWDAPIHEGPLSSL